MILAGMCSNVSLLDNSLERRSTAMIAFSSSIKIRRPPETVFQFLSNLHNLQQAGGSPVLAMEKLTPAPPGPGFRYREVERPAAT